MAFAHEASILLPGLFLSDAGVVRRGVGLDMHKNHGGCGVRSNEESIYDH
jgi:hypothetical protein